MATRILSNKAITFTLHVFAWLILFIIPYYVIKTFFYGIENYIPYRTYNSVIGYAIIFYLNYLWIVPKYFLNNKKGKYFLIAIATIIATSIVYIILDIFLFYGLEQKNFMNNGFPFHESSMSAADIAYQLFTYYIFAILITGFSVGFSMLKKHAQNEREKKDLEKEKLNSELALLKSQVSPHFFFNTLNNIDSLIDIDTNDAHGAIHKLSKLMRYLLYECQHESVLLSEEVNFIKNYIELMRLRLIKEFNLTVELPDDFNDLKVHPLLFIPFVENSFKHGISFKKDSFIHIRLTVEKNKIKFSTINSIGTISKQEVQYEGIGLENVKKRLTLLYPNKHKLIIEKNENKFLVDLELDL